jgi:hypothetical protein
MQSVAASLPPWPCLTSLFDPPPNNSPPHFQGGIVDNEEVERTAYNQAFRHFDVRGGDGAVEWAPADYANIPAGSKEPKTRWCVQVGSSAGLDLLTFFSTRRLGC